MNGRVCMITGANSGIGKATAVGLAKMGATVVMVCRDRGRGESALAEVKAASGNESVALMVADLSSQASIRRLAEEFRSGYPHLHVLINNAGVAPSKRQVMGDNVTMASRCKYTMAQMNRQRGCHIHRKQISRQYREHGGLLVTRCRTRVRRADTPPGTNL